MGSFLKRTYGDIEGFNVWNYPDIWELGFSFVKIVLDLARGNSSISVKVYLHLLGGHTRYAIFHPHDILVIDFVDNDEVYAGKYITEDGEFCLYPHVFMFLDEDTGYSDFRVEGVHIYPMSDEEVSLVFYDEI